ncbi:hypothetical protein Cni_G25254 [Canna indica]|uniref:Uncharacterized protein n=1 Tax=Canna indica TaxID=4628 RepID=A0AAQ3KWP4_9LILI|nr:hypothetical protein Cni_G25254 [Canna indica]
MASANGMSVTVSVRTSAACSDKPNMPSPIKELKGWMCRVAKSEAQAFNGIYSLKTISFSRKEVLSIYKIATSHTALSGVHRCMSFKQCIC